MNPHSDEFYHAAIKIAYPYACDIRKPLINGAVSPLFIGDTPHGTIVCKFGDADIVMRNRVLSELLAINNMPTPQTTTHAYLGTWFESYEYCPDLTLAEYIQSGKITDTQIFDVYRQVADVQYKISQINPVEFQPKTHRYFSDVFKTTIQMNIKKPLADVYAWLYKQLSQYGTTRLLHNDVHPGNILIDTQYRLTRLIDLDGISLCNDDCSILQTFWQNLV